MTSQALSRLPATSRLVIARLSVIIEKRITCKTEHQGLLLIHFLQGLVAILTSIPVLIVPFSGFTFLVCRRVHRVKEYMSFTQTPVASLS